MPYNFSKSNFSKLISVNNIEHLTLYVRGILNAFE